MTLMVVGIGYFAVITGAIAERFVERGEEERNPVRMLLRWSPYLSPHPRRPGKMRNKISPDRIFVPDDYV